MGHSSLMLEEGWIFCCTVTHLGKMHCTVIFFILIMAWDTTHLHINGGGIHVWNG